MCLCVGWAAWPLVAEIGSAQNSAADPEGKRWLSVISYLGEVVGWRFAYSGPEPLQFRVGVYICLRAIAGRSGRPGIMVRSYRRPIR